MKYQFVSLLFLILYLQVYPQWTWVSPLPQGQSINCIWFNNADTGILAGDDGTIIKTEDGGNSWEIIKDCAHGVSSDWSDVWFTDADTGYLVDYSRHIYMTTDGGDSWDQVYEGYQGEGINSITFIDNEHGFAVGSGGLLFETNNGGTSWTRRILNPADYFMSIRFSSPLNGNIVGISGTILHTSDGGNTWTVQHPENMSRLEGIHFASADEGFIYGFDGVIYKTMDGGTSWVLCPDLDSLAYIAMSSFNEDTLLLIGEIMTTHGPIRFFRSVDGGDSWSVITINSIEPMPRQVYCLNDGVAYATGSLGSIFKSVDAGLTWNPVSSRLNNNIISSFDFPSANVGYASLYNEEFVQNIRVLKTIDGGNSWFAMDSVFNGEIFYTVDFPTEDIGYIGGTNIYRTFDGGENWTQQYHAGWNNMIQSLSFPIASRGIAVGNNGLILRTTNMGFTWTTIESGTNQSLQSVCMTDLDTGYICGNKVFLKTTDGGVTWNLSTTLYDMGELSFLSSRIGYIAATSGILKTEDGGATFTDVAPPENTIPIRRVHFYDKDTGYVAGGTYITSSLILKTTNGGISWTQEELPTDFPIEAIYVTTTNKVFASGWPGFFFEKSNDFNTGIQIPESKQNVGIVECFPNPFKYSTKITYCVDKPAYVNLAIYDLSGNIVRKIIENHRDAGTYELIFDGSNLNPGTYFYEININGRTSTGKLVMLH